MSAEETLKRRRDSPAVEIDPLELDSDDEQPVRKKQKSTKNKPKKDDLPLGFSDDVISDPSLIVACALRSCEPLKLLLGGMEELVDNATLYFNPKTVDEDGDTVPAHMSINTLDSAHISLVNIIFNDKAFAEGFKCTRSVAVGLNFKMLSDVFKQQDKNEAVAIQVPDEVSFNLLFNQPGEKGISQWVMHQIDIDMELLGVPKNMPFTNVIHMPSATFFKIIKRLSTRCEQFGIKTGADSVDFCAKSEEIKGVQQTLYNGENDVEIEKHEDHPFTYSLPYMSKFANVCKVADRITLSFGTGTPLCVSCSILGGHATVQLFLSPKEDNDF